MVSVHSRRTYLTAAYVQWFLSAKEHQEETQILEKEQERRSSEESTDGGGDEGRRNGGHHPEQQCDYEYHSAERSARGQ